LIPRNRRRLIPPSLRLAHEYCFFLHDECARALVEYEGARAHIVTVNFRSRIESRRFSRIARGSVIEAMRATGYPDEARRVILNTVTMGMVSDCLHHIYEALRCMEKRKVVVAHNLLRKPLTDNLVYLSWMLGDEDAFFAAFSNEGGDSAVSRGMAARRLQIIGDALAVLPIRDVLGAEFIHSTLFDAGNPSGLYGLFQHAVHLVTAKYIQLRTGPEDFNFIFKSHADDDLYELLYDVLPQIMLFLSHVIIGLFDRMRPMDDGSNRAFEVRSILGLYLMEGGENAAFAIEQIGDMSRYRCRSCRSPFNVNALNAARLVLSESYRCPTCRAVWPFPYAWSF